MPQSSESSHAPIKLAERHGAVLAGRGLAIELRQEVERLLADQRMVVLDFSDVDAVSPSFADELFGKLVAASGEGRVKFANLSDPLQIVARMAHANRTPNGRQQR